MRVYIMILLYSLVQLTPSRPVIATAIKIALVGRGPTDVNDYVIMYTLTGNQLDTHCAWAYNSDSWARRLDV